MTKEIKAGMALGSALYEYKDIRDLCFHFGDMDMECWSEDSSRKRLAAKLLSARKAVRAWIPKNQRKCENCWWLCWYEKDPGQWYCGKHNIDSYLHNSETSSCAEWEPQKGGRA